MPYWRLFYHIVWATRDRLPLITPEIEVEVHRQVRFAAQRSQVLVHAIGGTTDHIHLVGSIPPSVAVATAVGRIKGGSAHALNRLLGSTTFGWQAEYGVVSLGERHLSRVVAYVHDQPRRHATRDLWAVLERVDQDSTEPSQRDNVSRL